jgi:hypothetical protein
MISEICPLLLEEHVDSRAEATCGESLSFGINDEHRGVLSQESLTDDIVNVCDVGVDIERVEGANAHKEEGCILVLIVQL